MDKSLPGPDHRASLTPAELKEMVKLIRQTEVALGSAEKKVLESERENRQKLKKSVVTRMDVKKGQKLVAETLAIKRPGYGFEPAKYYAILGKVAKRDIPGNTVLTADDVDL
jgi:sialic acid synthase SpsE